MSMQASDSSLESLNHPICATCNVPMWLMDIIRVGPHVTHRVYQCQVCEGELVVPLGEGEASNSTAAKAL